MAHLTAAWYTWCEASAFSGSGLPWYEAADAHFPNIYTHDIDGTRFHDAVQRIEGRPSDQVLVLFYSTRCPTCRRFAPEFELLALAAKNSTSEANRALKFATIDCIRHASACREFQDGPFPVVRVASKMEWQKGGSVKIDMKRVAKSAMAVATWLQNYTALDLTADLEATDPSAVMLRDAREALTGADALPRHQDIQLAIALLLRDAFALTPEWEASGKKQALLQFLELVEKRFPEESFSEDAPCSRSARELKSILAANMTLFRVSGPRPWSSDAVDPDAIERAWQLCDTDWTAYSRGWSGCKATYPSNSRSPDTYGQQRGFTCGLWGAFHYMLARSNDAEAAADVEVIRDTIHAFFKCGECRSHFRRIRSPKELGLAGVLGRRGASLWLWHAHNVVNKRVEGLEDRFHGAPPEFPKLQWPSPEACPTCRGEVSSSKVATDVDSLVHRWALDAKDRFKAEQWNIAEVIDFLERTYGTPSGSCREGGGESATDKTCDL